MRLLQTDIGNSGELHRLLLEYSKDTGKSAPNPEFWLAKFVDPTFFCLLAKHGKKPVGFIMGNKCSYYETPIAEISAVFVRRGFRKFRFIRQMLGSGKEYLTSLKFHTVAYTRAKARERVIIHGQ